MRLPDKPTPADRLRAAVDALHELDADEQGLVVAHFEAARERVLKIRRLGETAHVHDALHRPVVTEIAGLTGPAEDIDLADVRCHDCGRGLISDAGTERILVCPRLHGLRAAALRPTDPDGAVECGMES